MTSEVTGTTEPFAWLLLVRWVMLVVAAATVTAVAAKKVKEELKK